MILLILENIHEKILRFSCMHENKTFFFCFFNNFFYFFSFFEKNRYFNTEFIFYNVNLWNDIIRLDVDNSSTTQIKKNVFSICKKWYNFVRT